MAEDFPPITTLIPDLKEGDENSWTSLVELFTPGLAGKAHVLLRSSKLSAKLTPDDLLSETFAKAWKHHRLIRGQSTFQVAKWLLTIMTNSFRDHYRKGGLPMVTVGGSEGGALRSMRSKPTAANSRGSVAGVSASLSRVRINSGWLVV